MPKFNISILTREQLQFHEFLESDVLLSLGWSGKEPVKCTTEPHRKRILRLDAPLNRRNYDYIAKFFKQNEDSTNIVIQCDSELIRSETLVLAISTYFGLDEPTISKGYIGESNAGELPVTYSLYKALEKQFK